MDRSCVTVASLVWRGDDDHTRLWFYRDSRRDLRTDPSPCPQLVGILGFFPHFAFGQSGSELQLLAGFGAVFALATIAGLWLGKVWGIWAALVVLSFAALLDLFAWSSSYQRELVVVSALLIAAAVVVAYRLGGPSGPRIVIYQRILYACVLALAAWVAYWGLLRPVNVDTALPFPVPPLHARFFGSIYLAGTVYMVMAVLARDWSEVRVVSLVLAVWTVMLGIVSTINLPTFNWTLRPVWFWFVAYTSFPIVGWYVVWSQRNETEAGPGPPMSSGLRAYFYAQGILLTALALALFAAPNAMTTLWPWPMPPVVAQLYSAPLLAFGFGALYAAQQRTWAEVRQTVVAMLVFAASVLVVSIIHAGLFSISAPSSWIWFGGFGLAGLALLAFSLVPKLRSES